ncbi:unnamed protein product [Orchesella dallaii]|uniref:CCHC-type domain-containing protein n=1 Tax=Orchesella dallaii TaxID=48710 RepID=A0ABP1R5V2_9HEXA
MTDQAMKLTLPMAFKDAEATQWFLLNSDVLENAALNFQQVCDQFLADAPMNDGNRRTMHDILKERPKENEISSSSLLRIQFMAGEEWNTMTEEAIVDSLMDSLPDRVADYIDSQGRPPTFKGLKRLVKAYEGKRDSRFSTDHGSQIKREASVNALNLKSENKDELQTLVQRLYREVSELRLENAERKEKEEETALVRMTQSPARPQGPSDNVRPQFMERRQQQNPQPLAQKPDQREYRSFQSRGGYARQDRQPNRDIICHYCNYPGHIERYCRRRLGDNQTHLQNERAGWQQRGGRQWTPSRRGPPLQFTNQRQHPEN